MILKKITSTLITVLMSVSFSAYTESDFHIPKCTFNNLVLNDAAKQNYTDQNSDDNSSVETNGESNLKDEDNKTDDNENTSVDPELEKSFLDFLQKIFSELDDIIKIAQENYVKNGDTNDGADFKKSCGCKMEINKKYHHPILNLCDKHAQELNLLLTSTANSEDEDNCYPENCQLIDPDVDLDSDDWCELVCFDSPVSFIFRSSLLDDFDLITYDENKSTNINNSIPPAQKTCSEASNNINSTLELNDENAIQSSYTDDDLDDSIFAGMLADVRDLRLEDICEFNSQITIPNQDDYIHNYSKEDLLANITLADVCEYISFDDPRSIIFAILPDETFINITDEDIKILEEKAIKLKEASITK